MMRARDYAEDLAWVLTRRTSWEGSEVQGLAERMRRAPRCYLGLHYPSFKVDGHYDPIESWECAECGREAYPVRMRIAIWFWTVTEPVWFRYYEWRERRREDDE
jgi:hypothetical protein